MEARNRNSLTAIAVAAIAAAAAVICVSMATERFVGYKKTASGSGLSATGSASQDFESDLIVWRGGFTAGGETMKDAYDIVKYSRLKSRASK